MGRGTNSCEKLKRTSYGTSLEPRCRKPVKLVAMKAVILLCCITVVQSHSQKIDVRNANVTITSPSFPDVYPANISVLWNVEVRSLMSFTLSITDLSVEKSEGCKFDRLHIRPSLQPSSRTLLGPLCGNFQQQQPNLSASIVSHGFVVEFVSDSSVQYQGFSMEVTGIPFLEQQLCEFMFDQEEFLLSSNQDQGRHQYAGNLNCSWNLSAAPNKQIKLRFVRLDIEFSGPDCLYDRIEVWDSKVLNGSTDDKLLARLCGRHPPWTMPTFSTEIRVSFISDRQDNTGGFLIHYELDAPLSGGAVAMRKNWANVNPQTRTLLGSDLQGSFRLVWKFRTDPGLRIGIKKNFFLSITMYDGPDLTSQNFQVDEETEYFSNGFHLVTVIDFSVDDNMKYSNITYYSEVSYSFEMPLHLAYGASVPTFFFSTHVVTAHYVAAIDSSLKINLNNIHLYDIPNIDNCAYAGIAVYDGYLTATDLIGLFCDTNPSYLNSLSFTSSRSLIVVLYDYTDRIKDKMKLIKQSVSDSRCQGFTLSERLPPTESYRGDLFDITMNMTESVWDISIGYNATAKDCLKVQIVRQFTSRREIRLSLTGMFSYRICRRWDIHDILDQSGGSADSKYDNTERCDDKKSLANEVRREVIPVSNNAGWSQQFVLIDLGSASSVLCGQVLSCSSDTQITVTMPCGILMIFDPEELSCAYEFVMQSAERFWHLVIMKYASARIYQHLYIVDHIKSVNLTVSSRAPELTDIMMPYEIYSMNAANLELSAKSIYYMHINFDSVKFDTLRPKIGKTKWNEDCYILQDHCYMLSHHKEPTSWLGAKETCLKHGGYLVSINSLKELQLLKRAFSSVWLESFHGNGRGLIYIGLQNTGDHYRWEDGGPLTVTDWYYPFDTDNLLPYDPEPPINRQLIQPVADPSLRCAGMVPGNSHQATNWRKVNCYKSQFSSALYSICEYNSNGHIAYNNKGSTEYNHTGLIEYNNTGSSEYNHTGPIEYNHTESIEYNKTGSSKYNHTGPIEYNHTESIKYNNTGSSKYNHTGPIEYNKTGSNEYNNTEPMEYNNTGHMEYNKGHISHDSVAEDATYRCQEGWNFVHNTCLLLLTEIGGSPSIDLTSSYASEQICNQYGGRLPNPKGIPKEMLRYFLTSRGISTAVSDVWVKLPSGKTDRVTLFELPERPISYRKRHIFRFVYLCEKEPIKITCTSLHFQCRGGACIHSDRVCDLNKDCAQGDDEWNCSLSRTDLFRCNNGQKISASRSCDFHLDCLDESDEIYCVHRNCSESEHRCRNGQCVSVDIWCDQKADCIDGSDEANCDYERLCKGFKCPVDGCVNPSAVVDLQPDCPDNSQLDEINITDYGYNCSRDLSEIRCHRYYSSCYPSSKTCVYDHDAYNQLKYCRNAAHLKYCEDFECPGMFQCPKSYCMPYHKVCDGVQDCARGEDESLCDDNPCPGKLRCGSTSQCVSQENVCDGVVNCKQDWSDERFCDLLNFSCPPNCTCIGYSIYCNNNELQRISDIEIMTNIRVLHLGQNNISLYNFTVEFFPYLSQLYLAQNNIKCIPLNAFNGVHNLLLLDLSNNNIDVMPASVFEGLGSLHTLEMQGNPIQQITPGSFHGLSSLRRLNLSGMLLTQLGSHAFAGLDTLKSLDLSNNSIAILSAEAFASLSHLDYLLLERNSLELSTGDSLHNLSVSMLRTDSYKFCCVAGPNVYSCLPAVDDSSLCADLLSSDGLRVVVGTIGIISLLGNIFVIFWRLSSKLLDVPSVFVLNLSISDLLMGVYLVALSSADLYYRNIYIINDEKWRNSPYCKIIGVLGVISCEMSMYTLVFIAIDRTKQLAYPFSVTQFDIPTVWKIEIFGWIVCILYSISPFILPFYFGDYYSTNDICLPFNFTESKASGWEVTTAVFVCINSIGLLVIVVMYILIFYKVRDTQRRAGRRDNVELEVARKLSIVILTDLVCILPIILTSLLSILGHPVDRGMASVLASLFLPLNSALNPYLFSLSTLKCNRFCKKVKTVFKLRHSTSQVTRTGSTQAEIL